ncbi:hypothetical protein ACJMK2_036939 [Sinanodonta woodiana]|uniref:Uncharacterized protein n=1 Tax=Sinanodonta woodiana TaxID=1069815 RepID=A0ABD3WK39_SINWO
MPDKLRGKKYRHYGINSQKLHIHVFVTHQELLFAVICIRTIQSDVVIDSFDIDKKFKSLDSINLSDLVDVVSRRQCMTTLFKFVMKVSDANEGPKLYDSMKGL